MDLNFEYQKNMKAGSYTLVICICLLLLFIFVKWTSPGSPPPMVEEGIEVNLGNSDAGLGNDQPFEPGQPAPKEEQVYTPPQHAIVENTPVKDIQTDEQDADAPVIKKPPVTKPDATRITEKEIAKNKPVKMENPVAPPVPVTPKPKAVFKGVNGTGTGGNDADTYKKGGNEGIAGGRGDQGRPGGDPNSKNYEGNGGTGNSGVRISRGLQGRKITGWPAFQDDFNENAKIAVDIRVDESGKVISAVYQPRGSTSAASELKSIAIRKAMQIKLNAAGEESMGTIIFDFKVTN